MKKMTCAQMGGPADCPTEFHDETAEGIAGQAWKHVEEAHPDMAEKIQNNPKEVNDQWMADLKVKFAALPEA